MGTLEGTQGKDAEAVSAAGMTDAFGTRILKVREPDTCSAMSSWAGVVLSATQGSFLLYTWCDGPAKDRGDTLFY